MLDGAERLMTESTIEPAALRGIRGLDDVLDFLADDLDWPVTAESLDEVTYDYTPEELGIPPERLPRLESLRRLRPLTAEQPWGVFFIEFSGPRLPVTPLRRLLQSLVTKKRVGASGDRQSWELDDLLFFITTDAGDQVEVHLVAFFDAGEPSLEIRSLPWRPEQSPELHIDRLATELLPELGWPDDPADEVGWRERWRGAFKLRHGEAIRSAARLADRMAETATDLREQVAAALTDEKGSGQFSELLGEVRRQLVADVDVERFADMCAQTLVYGVLSSRVTDPIGFGASPTLSAVPLSNTFLSAFFEQVHDQAVDLDLEGSGLEQLVADLRETNVEAILDQFGSTAKGGDPVIHFYEEFLTRYDRQMRADAGAFYTPQPVVEFMVRTVDEILRTRFGLEMGIADGSTWSQVAEENGFEVPFGVDPGEQFVSMVDPATGTGTFLVEWLRRAKRSFETAAPRGDWAEHAKTHVAPSMHAFELMLAPYAIAHLKVALELHSEGADGADPSILLTDTLDELADPAQLPLVGDPVSDEGARARTVKETAPLTVCIGNPPYDRVTQDAGGGWITKPPGGGRSLFDDLLDVAREHTVFSHHASLYNLYVYFWRWAIWKVFEGRAGGPGVAAFITASSWLTGPGFVGLRQLAREVGDEIWVVDLGGDSRGAHPEENVFDIQTPVAIVFIVSAGAAAHSEPADVRYRRVRGVREAKLAALAEITLDTGWDTLGAELREPMVNTAGGDDWHAYPAVTDLFPWQQPGCKFGRTWPIAPDPEVLEERWDQLLAAREDEERARHFITPSSGRNIHSSVQGYERIVDLEPGAPHEPIRRYGYRSFDRQWAFDDPRMAKTESPSLWASLSDRQVFLATMPTNPLGSGAAASASSHVPDLHYFCGRGGKDIFPLYRDADGTPNADPALLEAIWDLHSAVDPQAADISTEDLFAYAYGVLAGSDYTERFRRELETPGPRIPLAADPGLFAEVAEFGAELIWIQTFGERFDGERSMSFDEFLAEKGIVWRQQPSRLPETANATSYEASTSTLRVADGELAGVSTEVWEFQVSGLPVVKKWLGYRTANPAGRAGRSSSPLDHTRATSWCLEWTDELVEVCAVLQATIDRIPTGSRLLDRVCEGELIKTDQLPEPPENLRKPPRVKRRSVQSGLEL